MMVDNLNLIKQYLLVNAAKLDLDNAKDRLEVVEGYVKKKIY